MAKIVEIENLSVQTDRGFLIRDLSLTLESGQVLGVVGESGSGKSLLMQVLLGLLPEEMLAKYEKIELFGQNPYDLTRKKLNELRGTKVGYVPQNTIDYLHPFLKIKNQIGDGFCKYKKTSKGQMLERAEFLLDRVGINKPKQVLNQYPGNLSGGMRQRVNIAMAMMVEPELLIADEPTTALDVGMQFQVMDLLKSIHQETNNSQIIISHDLSLIKNYTDYVLVIYNGEVKEYGETCEIFKNPKSSYTKALLSVVVDLETDKSKNLKDISYYMGREIVL